MICPESDPNLSQDIYVTETGSGTDLRREAELTEETYDPQEEQTLVSLLMFNVVVSFPHYIKLCPSPTRRHTAFLAVGA